MSVAALAMLVSASGLHAAWNFAAKRVGAGGAAFVWLYYSLSAALLVPVGVVDALVEHVRPHWWWLLAALGTAVLHVTYGVVLQRGYAVGDMSVVYPLARGTGPLLTVVVAVLVLGERPGAVTLLGVVAVVAGVGVISLRPASGSSALVSVVWGTLTGATIAAYTLWDDWSVSSLAIPPIEYFTAACVAQSALLAPYALTHRASIGTLWRTHRPEVLAVSVLSPLAYLLVLYAMLTTPVSVVAPVRELSIVVGGFLAWRLLGEANPVRRIVGSAIVLGGIVAIAVG